MGRGPACCDPLELTSDFICRQCPRYEGWKEFCTPEDVEYDTTDYDYAILITVNCDPSIVDCSVNSLSGSVSLGPYYTDPSLATVPATYEEGGETFTLRQANTTERDAWVPETSDGHRGKSRMSVLREGYSQQCGRRSGDVSIPSFSHKDYNLYSTRLNVAQAGLPTGCTSTGSPDCTGLCAGYVPPGSDTPKMCPSGDGYLLEIRNGRDCINNGGQFFGCDTDLVQYLPNNLIGYYDVYLPIGCDPLTDCESIAPCVSEYNPNMSSPIPSEQSGQPNRIVSGTLLATSQEIISIIANSFVNSSANCVYDPAKIYTLGNLATGCDYTRYGKFFSPCNNMYSTHQEGCLKSSGPDACGAYCHSEESSENFRSYLGYQDTRDGLAQGLKNPTLVPMKNFIDASIFKRICDPYDRENCQKNGIGVFVDFDGLPAQLKSYDQLQLIYRDYDDRGGETVYDALNEQLQYSYPQDERYDTYVKPYPFGRSHFTNVYKQVNYNQLSEYWDGVEYKVMHLGLDVSVHMWRTQLYTGSKDGEPTRMPIGKYIHKSNPNINGGVSDSGYCTPYHEQLYCGNPAVGYGANSRYAPEGFESWYGGERFIYFMENDVKHDCYLNIEKTRNPDTLEFEYEDIDYPEFDPAVFGNYDNLPEMPNSDWSDYYSGGRGGISNACNMIAGDRHSRSYAPFTYGSLCFMEAKAITPDLDDTRDWLMGKHVPFAIEPSRVDIDPPERPDDIPFGCEFMVCNPEAQITLNFYLGEDPNEEVPFYDSYSVNEYGENVSSIAGTKKLSDALSDPDYCGQHSYQFYKRGRYLEQKITHLLSSKAQWEGGECGYYEGIDEWHEVNWFYDCNFRATTDSVCPANNFSNGYGNAGCGSTAAGCDGVQTAPPPEFDEDGNLIPFDPSPPLSSSWYYTQSRSNGWRDRGNGYGRYGGIVDVGWNYGYCGIGEFFIRGGGEYGCGHWGYGYSNGYLLYNTTAPVIESLRYGSYTQSFFGRFDCDDPAYGDTCGECSDYRYYWTYNGNKVATEKLVTYYSEPGPRGCRIGYTPQQFAGYGAWYNWRNINAVQCVLGVGGVTSWDCGIHTFSQLPSCYNVIPTYQFPDGDTWYQTSGADITFSYEPQYFCNAPQFCGTPSDCDTSWNVTQQYPECPCSPPCDLPASNGGRFAYQWHGWNCTTTMETLEAAAFYGNDSLQNVWGGNSRYTNYSGLYVCYFDGEDKESASASWNSPIHEDIWEFAQGLGAGEEGSVCIIGHATETIDLETGSPAETAAPTKMGSMETVGLYRLRNKTFIGFQEDINDPDNDIPTDDKTPVYEDNPFSSLTIPFTKNGSESGEVRGGSWLMDGGPFSISDDDDVRVIADVTSLRQQFIDTRYLPGGGGSNPGDSTTDSNENGIPDFYEASVIDYTTGYVSNAASSGDIELDLAKGFLWRAGDRPGEVIQGAWTPSIPVNGFAYRWDARDWVTTVHIAYVTQVRPFRTFELGTDYDIHGSAACGNEWACGQKCNNRNVYYYGYSWNNYVSCIPCEARDEIWNTVPETLNNVRTKGCQNNEEDAAQANFGETNGSTSGSPAYHLDGSTIYPGSADFRSHAFYDAVAGAGRPDWSTQTIDSLELVSGILNTTNQKFRVQMGESFTYYAVEVIRITLNCSNFNPDLEEIQYLNNYRLGSYSSLDDNALGGYYYRNTWINTNRFVVGEKPSLDCTTCATGNQAPDDSAWYQLSSQNTGFYSYQSYNYGGCANGWASGQGNAAMPCNSYRPRSVRKYGYRHEVVTYMDVDGRSGGAGEQEQKPCFDIGEGGLTT